MIEPIYTCDSGVLYQGDCRTVLRELPASSVDAVVTDPPAGIEFMGKQWDAPKNYASGFTADGMDKGLVLPSKSSRNPTCRSCGGEKRRGIKEPSKQCVCDAPDFAEAQQLIEDREQFVKFIQEVMAECLRVLKPGGHALVWSLPRTSHWTATALENAGFEVRDCIYNAKDRSAEIEAFLDSQTSEQMELLLRAEPTDEFVLHLFGSGFPKSLDVSKAIDKAAGAEREVIGTEIRYNEPSGIVNAGRGGSARTLIERAITKPSSDAAKQWDGWGTALKPAVECWWLVRKPLDGTVAKNVLQHGVGGIHINASRVGDETTGRWPTNFVQTYQEEYILRDDVTVYQLHGLASQLLNVPVSSASSGLVKIDADTFQKLPEVFQVLYRKVPSISDVANFPNTTSQQRTGHRTGKAVGILGAFTGQENVSMGHSDSGSAARFFKTFSPLRYSAKAAQTDKNNSLDAADIVADLRTGKHDGAHNSHPTVKSQDLMQYLIQLITPKGGTVLDPFSGSGSTLIASISEGDRFIGIEQDPEYAAIAKQRLETAGVEKRSQVNQSELLEMVLDGAHGHEVEKPIVHVAKPIVHVAAVPPPPKVKPKPIEPEAKVDLIDMLQSMPQED